MSDLQDAIIRIDAAQLGGESLNDEPEYRAVELVTNTARRIANAPETIRNVIQAEIAAQDDLPETTAVESIDQLTEVVLAALGITTEDNDGD